MATNGFNKQAAIQRLGEKGEMTVAALHVPEVLIFAAQLPAAKDLKAGIIIMRGKGGGHKNEEIARFFSADVMPPLDGGKRVFTHAVPDYLRSPAFNGPFYIVMGTRKITKVFLDVTSGNSLEKREEARRQACALGVVTPPPSSPKP